MLVKKENQYGRIEVNRTAIGRAVLYELEHYQGRVRLSGKNARLAPFMRYIGGDNGISNMEIEAEEDVLYIKIYIVMEFGNSIGGTAGELLRRIESRVAEMLGGYKVVATAVVKGLLVKGEVRPRNIEVRSDGSTINEADR